MSARLPRGHAGSWFAEWEGEKLPCVHARWVEGRWPNYLDPKCDGRPKWDKFIAALKNGRKAILTTSHPPDRNGIMRRKSYVGVWEVHGVDVSDGELRFTFGKQVKRF